MAIKHSTTKAAGQKLFAVADWNADHSANGDIDFSPYKLTMKNFVSNVATGTQPYACTSTTLNTNLNADLWDGYQFASYLNQAVKTTSSPTFTALTILGDISCSGFADGITIYMGDTTTWDGSDALVILEELEVQGALSSASFTTDSISALGSRVEILDPVWMYGSMYFNIGDDGATISVPSSGYLRLTAVNYVYADTPILFTRNTYPIADNTYYLGKNSISTPYAYKGVILKDTTNGNYYRIEVTNGAVVATQIT